MDEERKIEVEGRAYRLRPWLAKDGQMWAFKLTRIALASAGALESEQVALASLLDRVTVEEFTAFRDVCLRYTDLVERDEDGAELVLDLTKSPARLEGRYLDLFAIMEGHLTHEFGPFFAGLLARLGAQKEVKKRPQAGG